MANPLFQLGSFQFDLPNGVPQTLERTAEFRWEGQDRILREPSYQFVGPGSQEITLDGVLYPGFSGKQGTMETLRELATKGEPQMFSDGLGKVYGKWCIASLREGLAVFAPGGGARQITFSIRLVRYGEDNPGAAAAPSSVSSLSSEVNPFAATNDLGLGLRIDGSAFAASKWARNLPLNAPALAAATKTAGITVGQLTSIAKAVINKDYVGAGLGAFGLAGVLDPAKIGAWGQMGVDAAKMVQQMALGRGAPSIAVALEALRPATGAILDTLGGSVGGREALEGMIRDASTISTLLDVDPKVTEIVEAIIKP